NAVLFTEQTPAISSVTVSPGTATVSKGQNAQFTANVVATGFAPKNVVWSVEGTEETVSTITDTGLLTVPSNETNTSLTVKATSVFNSTKVGSATVTISN